MVKISITQVPKPENREPGVHDLVIGWFPEPLLGIEQKFLAYRGALPNKIRDQTGYLIGSSLGTIPYDDAQKLMQNALDEIKRNPAQRYLAIFNQKS